MLFGGADQNGSSEKKDCPDKSAVLNDSCSPKSNTLVIVRAPTGSTVEKISPIKDKVPLQANQNFNIVHSDRKVFPFNQGESKHVTS